MKLSKVESVMVGEVISVTPATPFKDVAKLLAEHDITGLPVLDDDGTVLGVVSESDLLVRQASAGGADEEQQGPRHGRTARSTADTRDDKREGLTAGLLMSAPAITVKAEDTVAEAARTMLRRGVERLPVVDAADRLVGIVTRRDLLQVFLRPDSEIRRHVIEDVLRDVLGLAPNVIDVHVVDGVVTLVGQLERHSQISVVLQLTQRLDGVVAVVDRLSSRVSDSGLTPPEGAEYGWPW
ncbi:CBS domain-containing protein [Streptomyces lunaelactis]|uniref:CBS domain-containing protein n=1 Tax=Streptomyces lunaelactis TaxID=1535768 RepID=UPI001585A1AA|nr:CBS domain-containing protein [Streptomyces lunaelactis]NUK06862.1 CBS domain-containing protein [Streptomyces lunaelactis]NUK33615.1 CBS domain-containing protein [Streptomyces lunaelactis]NUK39364.1 CBS domain-containing protein [Streptomyces lunaelactis]NUK70084.1 CBS domain-containing protein [Streptomyces lunaelactis]NUK77457.1 CBS domain-containing protein [Streptomyces lunaelactis]